jgi:pimeloyl-ACP methyl ester carboxylesterase
VINRSTSSPTTSATEERLFFESGGRPLYGVLRRGLRADAPLVLFCNSFAADHDAKWRAEVVGARIAAQRGYVTFSYHPRGHGDSAGNFADVTFEGLVEDAENAACYALRVSRASRIVWVGIRFGALVAAAALRRRKDTAALALWEPIHNARAYFRELMRQTLYRDVALGHRPSMTVDQMMERLDRKRSVEVRGFELYRAFSQSAIGADLIQSLEDWRGPTLIAQFRRRETLARDNIQLQRTLERRGAQVVASVFIEPRNPNSQTQPQWFDEELVRHTAAWLDGLD